MPEISHLDLDEHEEAFSIIEYREGNTWYFHKCFDNKKEADEALIKIKVDHPKSKIWRYCKDES